MMNNSIKREQSQFPTAGQKKITFIARAALDGSYRRMGTVV